MDNREVLQAFFIIDSREYLQSPESEKRILATIHAELGKVGIKTNRSIIINTVVTSCWQWQSEHAEELWKLGGYLMKETPRQLVLELARFPVRKPVPQRPSVCRTHRQPTIEDILAQSPATSRESICLLFGESVMLDE